MVPLTVAPSASYGRDLLTRRVHEQAGGNPLRILEAGCGREWNVDVSDLDVHLTGIDLDEEALAHRRDVVGDLDVAIHGDLRTADLPDDGYDVVFSAFVLEHISGAESVMDAMVRSLRPGGLLILRVPDRNSVYGFMVRMLPHWVHVLFKRYVEKVADAGKPGHPPYRVVYDDVVSRPGFRRFVDRHGLELVDELGTNPHIASLGRLGPGVKAVERLVAALSFGRLAADHQNLTYVIRKP